MKTTRSLLMLFAGTSAYRLLIILFVTCGAEYAVFCLTAASASGLEQAFEGALLPLICLIGFLLYCLVLAIFAYAKNSSPQLTLRRLRLSYRKILLLQSLFNTAMLIVFWGAQLGTFLLMFRHFSSLHPGTVGPQNLPLLFYRNRLLHAFLPLRHTLLWLRNLLLFPVLGIVLAGNPFGDSERSVSALLMIALTVLGFRNDYSEIRLITFIFLPASLIFAYASFKKAVRFEDPQPKEDDNETET